MKKSGSIFFSTLREKILAIDYNIVSSKLIYPQMSAFIENNMNNNAILFGSRRLSSNSKGIH